MSLISPLLGDAHTCRFRPAGNIHGNQTIHSDFGGVILTALAASVNISFMAGQVAFPSSIRGER